MKKCKICKKTKDLSLFHKDKTGLQGRKARCKACQAIISKAAYKYTMSLPGRREAKRARDRGRPFEKSAYFKRMRARPKWAIPKQIEAYYRKAREKTLKTGIKYSVDHIIPLIGRNVCGLHCEENLQIITLEKNLKKHRSTKAPSLSHKISDRYYKYYENSSNLE